MLSDLCYSFKGDELSRKTASKLSIEMVPIDSVSPDPRNARLHPQRNLDTIKQSLQHYGQRKPIVVNKNTMHIEAGNGMYEAAKSLGWKQIAAVMVDDDEDTAKAFGIMDNQSALLAEWDIPTLKDLLGELDTGAFDMDLTGFNVDEIEQMMTAFHVDDVDAPELSDVDRSPFQQMTFTLHDEQVEIVNAAIKKAKADGHAESSVNENSNGNAISWVAEVFNRG